MFQCGPVSCLAATVLTDVLLMVSPLLPARALGLILVTCQRRAFQLRGIRRLRLSGHTAKEIGKTNISSPVIHSETAQEVV